MPERQVTGNWYLKKGFFGYKVMVEVIIKMLDQNDFTFDPPCRTYQKARTEDLIELGIKVR